MAKTKARWIVMDSESLEANGDALRVFLLEAGGIERTASGIRIKTSGVTDAMLAGNIAFTKLADSAVIARLDQAETVAQHWDFPAGASTPTINTLNIATESYVDNAMTGLDFQPDVLANQIDTTVDPGVTPTIGDRYILSDVGNRNANFGAIADVDDGDIVEYVTGDLFEVVYDVSVEGAGAIVWDTASVYFTRWDNNVWSEFGGLAGITAGAGLTKDGNTIHVGSGVGITAGIDDVAVKPDETGGANLAKAISAVTNGVGVKVDDVTIEGDTTTGQLKVKADSIGAAQIDETDTFDYTEGSIDVADKTAGNNSTSAANTKYVDSAVNGLSTERKKIDMHLISSGEVTSGFFLLNNNPTNASTVSLTVVGGPQQVNKQVIGVTGQVADFDVLSVNELNINNSGAATGLSEQLTVGDIVIIEYSY